MQNRCLISLCLLVPLLASAADDSNNYYGQREEGWFWYKDPKANKPVQAKSAQLPEAEEPKPFTVKWLKDNMDKTREAAIDNPTNADGSPSREMVAYMYLQRVVLDKSQNFANAAEQVVQTDPLLDENNRIPFGSAARAAFMRDLDNGKDQALAAVAQKTGLWFFFDSKCKFCVAQQNVVAHFAKEYGFAVRNISLDQKPLSGMTAWLPDRGQSQLLKLRLTPTIVLVQPPNNFYVISQGLSSEETIGRKIMLVASTQKILPDNFIKDNHPFDKGILANKDLQSEKLNALKKDPNSWVKYLQESLGQSYQ